MQRLLIILVATFVSPTLAGDHEYWSKWRLAGYNSSLVDKVQDHVAIEELGKFGSHFVLMVYRTGTGNSALHDADTDFYVVQAGEATLHVGGKIIDPKTISPGEVRGSSIKGGKTVELKPGDTVNIPPSTPHQVVIQPGKSITYMILKIHK